MEWDDGARGGVETAINEADVAGLRLPPDTKACDVLLHVAALPPSGPLDRDGRRILRLLDPGQVKVLLRHQLPPVEGGRTLRYGPVLPLADLEAVEDFFASLTWAGSLYGWEFFDTPERTRDWPARPSLTLDVSLHPSPHTFYWFNECGRTEEGGPTAYCIEGTVTFEDLSILRADATPISLDEFVADGRRVWDAMHAHDERMSVDAQRDAHRGVLKWRDWAVRA